ncbi:hypothetical protein J5834_05635 [bacterium]|nr:hypothetical protein [bacterium]
MAGFEDDSANWVIDSVNSSAPCWEIGIPTSGPGEAHSGMNVAATSLAGNYADNCADVLRYNKSIFLPPYGDPTISFYAWVDIVGSGYAPFDYVEVLIKRDDEIWETVTGIYLSADTPSPLQALDNTKTKITKQLGTAYYIFTGDISALKGRSIEIGFRFISDASDNSAGFYLDDITIYN